MLEAALRLSSGKPLMNAVAAEIALFLEDAGLEVTIAEHVKGTLNFITDALSRLEAGKALPQVLADVERVPAPVRGPKFYKAWPRDWKSTAGTKV